MPAYGLCEALSALCCCLECQRFRLLACMFKQQKRRYSTELSTYSCRHIEVGFATINRTYPSHERMTTFVQPHTIALFVHQNSLLAGYADTTVIIPSLNIGTHPLTEILLQPSHRRA